LNRLVLAACLWLLHSMFTCFLYLSEHSNTLLLRLQHKFRVCGNAMDKEKISRLNKVPKHIAFLVLEKEIYFAELARLVVWSVQAGIDVISLYDIKGRLKRRQDVLLDELGNKFRQETFGPLSLEWRPHQEEDQERAVIVGEVGGEYPDREGRGRARINGNGGRHTERTVTVSLLGPEDGKGDIVKAAKIIAREVEAGQMEVTDINEDALAAKLNSNKGLPDPCLLIRLGATSSNGDFLPWQIRLTELHSLPSQMGLVPQQLEDILQRYGGCEQRFGK